MADKAISAATAKATLADGDMIPVAATGETTAYHITGLALNDSLRDATAAVTGVVELATAAETLTGTDGTRAVTPAGLAAAVGPTKLAAGYCYCGVVSGTVTTSSITTAANAALGRARATGDLITCKDSSDNLYILAFDAASGGWYGCKFDTGTGAGTFVYYM